MLAALAIARLATGGAGLPANSAPLVGNLAGKPVDYRYAVLSNSHSNQCNLQSAEMMKMANGVRLRGGCCFPMDRAHYEQQLRELRGYAGSGVVPSDPYDVSVVLAKRLLGFRSISLNRHGRATYRRAVQLSRLGGPCCCRCWRWQAFKGQAHFMIARRGYTAQQVADLWEREEGCGGPEGS